jgi:hypothetical protein
MNWNQLRNAAKTNTPIYCLYNRHLDRVETSSDNLPILSTDVVDLVETYNVWNGGDWQCEINDRHNGRTPGYGLLRWTNGGTAMEVRFFNPGDVIRICAEQESY